jgi:hypothetical protein
VLGYQGGRTLPAWLRSVLIAMHRHCRGPDCDRPANWTQAHHGNPWSGNWITDLLQSLPLCVKHHKLIDEGWDAQLDTTTGAVTWTSPTAKIILVPPPRD